MGWLADSVTWNDALGNISYILIAASYYLTRMFWLRVLAVIGLGIEILYFTFSGGALMTGISWNAIFIAINLYQLWQLGAHARLSRRAPELAVLRHGMLGGLDDAQIGRLFRTGGWRDLAKDAVLTREGEPVTELYLLCGGRARVLVDGACIATLRAGSFVGEIAFLSGAPACATVVIDEAARVFAFDPDTLRRLIRQDEAIAAVMHRTVGRDLARKLSLATHPGAALSA